MKNRFRNGRGWSILPLILSRNPSFKEQVVSRNFSTGQTPRLRYPITELGTDGALDVSEPFKIFDKHRYLGFSLLRRRRIPQLCRETPCYPPRFVLCRLRPGPQSAVWRWTRIYRAIFLVSGVSSVGRGRKVVSHRDGEPRAKRIAKRYATRARRHKAFSSTC